MKKLAAFILGISITLPACGIGLLVEPQPIPTVFIPPITPTVQQESIPTAIIPTTTPSPAATIITSTSTNTPPPPIPTIPWVKQGPGAVTVPILMYHHIGSSEKNIRYYMSPENFEQEMKLLYEWGYTTITTEMMVKAILEGTDLPARPVIVTFDDGGLNNYTTAFPIMQKYGFQGVLYLVPNYIGADGFMNVDQIKEMISAGWEVGSHSMSHKDLITLDTDQITRELTVSKETLEQLLGVPVTTFAYPFASYTEGIVERVRLAGYSCAMGVSYLNEHSVEGLFQLHRREIKGTYDLNNFILFLPWQGDLSLLPGNTPTPEQ